jgi:hypothetical protein
LNVLIGAGNALTSTDTQPFSSGSASITLPANGSYRIWLHPDGTFSTVLAVSSTPPVVGAIQLAGAIGAAGVITSITDRRTYVSRAVLRHTMTLKLMGDSFVGTGFDFDVLGFDADLVGYRVSSRNAYALAADVKVDIKYSVTTPTTIFTSSGTSDLRPVLTTLAFSQMYSTTGSDHEVISFDAGTGFTFDIVSQTNIVTDVIVQLYFERRN